MGSAGFRKLYSAIQASGGCREQFGYWYSYAAVLVLVRLDAPVVVYDFFRDIAQDPAAGENGEYEDGKKGNGYSDSVQHGDLLVAV
jgi:hypothetical protein